jgi:hypothetical protein
LEILKGRDLLEYLCINRRIIKIDLRETGLEGVDWIHWLRTGTSGRLVNTVMNFQVP